MQKRKTSQTQPGHKAGRRSKRGEAIFEDAKRAVLKVGEGRGFVVRGKFIITAAHCLPELPPPASFSFPEERTYFSLVGRLGEKPTIAAECKFVDPIADIAILGEPDSQNVTEESEAWSELLDRLPPLSISPAPPASRRSGNQPRGRRQPDTVSHHAIRSHTGFHCIRPALGLQED